jgi:hypothetical protein
VKSGVVGDLKWDRAPRKFVFYQDLDLANTFEDPHKFLKLWISVPNIAMTKAQTPWRGARKKSNVFFQILIEACPSDQSIVANLSAEPRASLRTCRASGKHFFGLEADNDIFEELLKPLACPSGGMDI